jgi:hypothetical protein
MKGTCFALFSVIIFFSWNIPPAQRYINEKIQKNSVTSFC